MLPVNIKASTVHANWPYVFLTHYLLILCHSEHNFRLDDRYICYFFRWRRKNLKKHIYIIAKNEKYHFDKFDQLNLKN